MIDDELDEETEEETGNFDGGERIDEDEWTWLAGGEVVWWRRRDDELCSLLLPRCLSSNERKNARAFSTAVLADAEC